MSIPEILLACLFVYVIPLGLIGIILMDKNLGITDKAKAAIVFLWPLTAIVMIPILIIKLFSLFNNWRSAIAHFYNKAVR